MGKQANVKGQMGKEPCLLLEEYSDIGSLDSETLKISSLQDLPQVLEE